MKLTVLIDNNTYIDQYYLGEPALSFYIEVDGARVLFDAGYSDAFVKNAEKLGVDLSALTHVVLSHGHDDHTRGLPALFAQYDLRQIPLIAHPACFLPKRSGSLDIGAPYNADEIVAYTDYRPSVAPVWLTEHLIFLGEIPRTLSFEVSYAMGERQREGQWEPDTVTEDSALVYRSNEGIFVITGCSHSGICNIIEYAKKICDEERVLGVIGGFHLFSDDARLAQTIDYLTVQQLKLCYPCHCVSLTAKAKMLERLPVGEVGVGMTLTIEN
ncbi:MAG: MBL fold metallo-hydrolase [Peptococcaceae bacterium]|nr:MBL fold metallo-hydrolase [Peptococcaceae bacterium]